MVVFDKKLLGHMSKTLKGDEAIVTGYEKQLNRIIVINLKCISMYY